MNEELLFEALSEVGDDLLVMAENRRFVSPWRKWGQTAAALAVVVCLGVFALPYFPRGCGSVAEQEKTMASTTQETCIVEESTAEEVMECEEAADGAAGEDTALSEAPEAEVRQSTKAEPMTKIICRGTYYYLLPEDTVTGVPPLGEELGTVESYEDLSLAGSTVYTVPYSTWFGNHAVNGQPVTQQVYVQTLSGYRYGTTCNEKVVSRYTIDDVRRAIEEDDMKWLADTFVQPIETAGGVDFMDSAELSSEELNTMFLASTVMNTGTVVSARWMDEAEGTYVVPISDVRWRLDRFLDEGYVYEPQTTEFYDADRHAMVCPVSKVKFDLMDITVHAAEELDENRLFLLISLPEQKGVAKEYIIRFDEDSWRYETIHEIDPDSAAE